MVRGSHKMTLGPVISAELSGARRLRGVGAQLCGWGGSGATWMMWLSVQPFGCSTEGLLKLLHNCNTWPVVSLSIPKARVSAEA